MKIMKWWRKSLVLLIRFLFQEIKGGFKKGISTESLAPPSISISKNRHKLKYYLIIPQGLFHGNPPVNLSLQNLPHRTHQGECNVNHFCGLADPYDIFSCAC